MGLPCEEEAADVLPIAPGEGGGDGLGRVFASEIAGYDLIPAAAEGEKFRRDPFVVVNGDPEGALVPQLVKAPAFGTAGVGPMGIPLPP